MDCTHTSNPPNSRKDRASPISPKAQTGAIQDGCVEETKLDEGSDASTVTFFIQDTYSCDGISIDYTNFLEDHDEISARRELYSGNEADITEPASAQTEHVPPSSTTSSHKTNQDRASFGNACSNEKEKIPKCIEMISHENYPPRLDSVQSLPENSQSKKSDDQIVSRNGGNIHTGQSLDCQPIKDDNFKLEHPETFCNVEQQMINSAITNSCEKSVIEIIDFEKTTNSSAIKQVNTDCNTDSLASIGPSSKFPAVDSKEDTPGKDIIVLDDSSGDEMAAFRVRPKIERKKRRRNQIMGNDSVINLCDSRSPINLCDSRSAINLCGSTSEDDCGEEIERIRTTRIINPVKRVAKGKPNLGKLNVERKKIHSSEINLDSSEDECFFAKLPSSGFKRDRSSTGNESHNRHAKKRRLNTFSSMLSKNNSPIITMAPAVSVQRSHKEMERIRGHTNVALSSPQLYKKYKPRREVEHSQEIIEIDSD